MSPLTSHLIQKKPLGQSPKGSQTYDFMCNLKFIGMHIHKPVQMYHQQLHYYSMIANLLEWSHPVEG